MRLRVSHCVSMLLLMLSNLHAGVRNSDNLALKKENEELIRANEDWKRRYDTKERELAQQQKAVIKLQVSRRMLISDTALHVKGLVALSTSLVVYPPRN